VCATESSAMVGYIGAEGSLHRLGKVGFEQMDDRPAIHVAGQPLFSASCLGSFLVNECTDVSTKPLAELTQTLAGQARSWACSTMYRSKPTQTLAGRARNWAGRAASGPTWSMCQILPVVMLSLTIVQLHFVIH
jgi:hypothetical protein